MMMRNGGRSGLWRLAARALAGLAAALALPAAAQSPPTASVISPLKTQPDVNNVNIGTGLIRVDVPTLSVPAAPRLKFGSLQDAVPYIRTNIGGSPGSYVESSVAVHTGASSSEQFRCIYDDVCTNVKSSGAQLDGSIALGGPYSFTEASSGAVYVYDSLQFDSGPIGSRQRWWYATSITYPDGEVISFTYQTAPGGAGLTHHRLTRMSSNIGYRIDFTYEGTDPGLGSWQWLRTATLVKSDAPGAPLARLAYADDGTVTQYGENDAAFRVYACSGCRNGIRAPAEWSAVSLSLPTEGAAHIATATLPVPYNDPIVASVVRDGVTWNYAYGNLRTKPAPQGYTYDNVVVTGPDGYRMTYNITQTSGGGPNLVGSIVDANNRTTAYDYDSRYRPVRITAPEGNAVQISYDFYSNIVSKVTHPRPGSGLTPLTETAGIDEAACQTNRVRCFRPVWVRDALQRQTDYSYDDAGRLIRQLDPPDEAGVRPEKHWSYGGSFTAPTLVRQCGSGRLCGTPAELRIEYSYLGQTALPLTETRIDGLTGVSLTTSYQYDAAGRLLMEDGPLPGTGDAKYFRYDAFGRKTWEIGPANADGSRPATRFTYRISDDKMEAAETGVIPDAGSFALTVSARVDTAYDPRRNPVRVATSGGGATHSVQDMSWDGRGQKICDTVRMNPAAFGSLPADACTLGPEGEHGPDRITRNVYDAAGQLVHLQKAVGTPLWQSYATYTYTANGKVHHLIDANGNATGHGYDGFDRPDRLVFPSKTIAGDTNPADFEAYGYDAVGNRTSLRKRDGVTITYGYDNLNRMTVKTVPPSASGAAGYSVHYGYDVRGLQTFARFGSAAGPGIANSYDGFGRLTASTSTMGGVSRTVSFLYDPSGNRIRVTHPDEARIDFAYDAGGRLLTAGWPGYGFLQNYWDNLGRPTSSWRGGSVAQYHFDAASRLGQLTNQFAGGVGNVATVLGYNPASQIVARTRNNDDYRYANYVTTDRGYEANGLNQYARVAGVAYGYDGNGNLTSDGANGYVYDAENRLVSSTLSGGTVLAYDPLGRLWQVASPNTGTTQFVYEGDHVAVEYDGAGAVRRRYAWAPGADRPLFQAEGATLDCNTARFLYADHQGSIVATATCAGARVAVNSYDEYGVPAASNWGRFQYTGQAWLPQLGMYYYKARIYAPQIGRFLQTDPIGYEDQINLYAYVGNDPVNAADPSGMCTGSLISNSDGTCKGASGFNPTLNGVGIVDGPVPGTKGSDYAELSSPASSSTSSSPQGVSGGLQLANSTIAIPTPGQVLATAEAAAARALGLLGILLSLSGDTPQTTTLWRAVSPAELVSITATRQFSIGPSGFSQKQFFFAKKDADWLGQAFSPSTIVSTQVTFETLAMGYRFRDAGRAAISFEGVALRALNVDAARFGIHVWGSAGR